jgi:hypothetical protein
MTTRTIRETDITIFDSPRTEQYGASRIYRLAEKFRPSPTREVFGNYAEALQARADIIDERAGAAQVGDVVRVGLKGQVRYIVGAIMPWGELRLTSESNDRTVRYFMPDRVHVVKAIR